MKLFPTFPFIEYFLIVFILLINPLQNLYAKAPSIEERKDYQIYDHQRDSIWLPATIAINGTFDVLQNPYWFNQEHFSDKAKTVWERVNDPTTNIKRDGGYSNFFQDEFFSSRVFPNIGLHFLGGAYDTLWLTEYFQAHHFPMPRLLAFIVTYATHLGNEALETSSDQITSHDHIADLYIFDLAAFFMASSEKGMKFLLNDMGMQAWHFNPMFDVDSSDFFNTGLNYIFRPQALTLNKGVIQPLFFLGMQVMGGASYHWKGDHTTSMAMGINLTDPLKQKGRLVTALFHEYNKNLGASLFFNGSEDFRWRLNVTNNFSNLLTFIPKDWRLGFMIGQKRGPSYAVGFNLNMPFGIGGIKNSPPAYFTARSNSAFGQSPL